MYVTVLIHKVTEIVASDFQWSMKSLNSSRSVVEEKYIVANIQFIVSERHASGGVPTFDFFHELDQFIAMFTNFSGEIFRNVNVGAF